MKYKSQKVAYWFFALSMLLLFLQLVYGFIMGFAHAGFDGLHSIIPFKTAKAVHTNLLVVLNHKFDYIEKKVSENLERIELFQNVWTKRDELETSYNKLQSLEFEQNLLRVTFLRGHL